MKTLCLIRHAKSSWSDFSLSDFDRPLNKRGLRDAPRMANFLIKKKGISPDIIISSPANRALSTATYFAEEAGISMIDIVHSRRLYEAFPRIVFETISKIPNHFNTAFIFGHNPTFTDVINEYTDEYLLNLPTCGIAQIFSTSNSWEDVAGGINSSLKNLYFPKEVL